MTDETFESKLIKQKQGANDLKNNLFKLIRQKEIAENRKIDINEIARESGVSRGTLWRAVNKENNMSPRTVENLCRYFNCQPGDLIYVEKEKTSV